VANTRNRGANENNNNNANPPPPPTLEQVLIMQAQMLQTIQQTMANMQQAQGHQPAPQPQPRDKLGEFQQTKPPTFSHSIEPMDVDDLLKTIKKKLQVAQCNNHEKVMFASHQLDGPAADWWDAYVEAHKESETINWQEFKNSFRSHHVPLGVMKLKKLGEFGSCPAKLPSRPTKYCGLPALANFPPSPYTSRKYVVMLGHTVMVDKLW
jgi:hypothetical protein